MGILFVRKIVEQKEKISDVLRSKGLIHLIFELDNFTSFLEEHINNLLHAPITVIKLDNSIAKQLSKKKTISYEEVIDCCKTNDYRTIYNCFKEGYFEIVAKNTDKI